MSEAELRLARRHVRPEARVTEGVALARHGAAAMIDVSDGLAVDLDNLTEASGVGCNIEKNAIPIDPDLDKLFGSREALELAITGGEDFELLVALPGANLPQAQEACAAAGTPLTAIGEVTEGGKMVGEHSLHSYKERSWEHLKRR
jgi:thiamine-monophosphate kinase